jgi:hypothetical protein
MRSLALPGNPESPNGRTRDLLLQYKFKRGEANRNSEIEYKIGTSVYQT